MPDSPIAFVPWRVRSDARSWFTRPTSTIRATSSVGASVTRCPPTNRGVDAEPPGHRR